MTNPFSRRAFCHRLARGAGAVVLGFDPELRSWAVEKAGRPLVDLPRLDGALVYDAAVLDGVSQDNGRIVRRRPLAVLRPGNAGDIIRVVRYANTHRIRVAMRGQGHSSFGQAQAEAGIVIDSRLLRRILRVSDSEIDVEAGATWDEVAAATLARGRTPPVMADTQVITVGGTLSVAGMGNSSHRHGAIVDNVRELEVVTGGGRQLVCSETRERELFEMVLAGLGQCALIVRARLALAPAPAEVTLLDYDYVDLDAFLTDQRAVARDPMGFDHVGGRVTPRSEGAPRLRLTVGTFVGTRSGPPPSHGALLEANLQLAERVRRKGGTRYAGYGAVPFTPADWANHYGPATWARLTAAKRAFDPANVLTPGPGMF